MKDGKQPERLHLLVCVEGSEPSRYWEGALSLLVDSGVQVELVSVNPPGELHRRLQELGIKTSSLGCRNSRDYPIGVGRLRRIIRDNDIQLVHAVESIPGTLAGLASPRGRPRSIFHRQHVRATGKQRAFSLAASQLCRRTMAVSGAAALAAAHHDHLPARRISVAYSGVSRHRPVTPEEQQSLRERLLIPASAPVVVAVGRLRPEKGHSTLIRAAALLADRSRAQPHIVLVGTGPDEGPLRDLARRIDASIHFVGHQEDVAPWYAFATVIAIPSLQEAFGLVAVEAMASATPVVASRTGGLEEVVADGITGLLVPPGDADALATALWRVVENPEIGSALGADGYARFLELFTTEAMVDNWLRCYQLTLD